jgi:hypothetical protein
LAQGQHRRRITLRDHLDRAVGEIPGDAAYAEPLGLEARAVPEEDALNLAVNTKTANDLAQGKSRLLT